MQNEAAAL